MQLKSRLFAVAVVLFIGAKTESREKKHFFPICPQNGNIEFPRKDTLKPSLAIFSADKKIAVSSSSDLLVLLRTCLTDSDIGNQYELAVLIKNTQLHFLGDAKGMNDDFVLCARDKARQWIFSKDDIAFIINIKLQRSGCNKVWHPITGRY